MVRLTAFAYTTVPPPMCSTKLTFPTATCISSVCLPGLWTAKHGGNWPILVQLSNSVRMYWLEMSIGWTKDQRRIELAGGNLILEREQVAKNAAPFVRQALVLA